MGPIGLNLAVGTAGLGLVFGVRLMLTTTRSTAQLRRVRNDLGLRLPPTHRRHWLVLWPVLVVALSVGASQAATAWLGAPGGDPRAEAVHAGGWGRGLLTAWLSGGMAEELLFRGLLLLFVARVATRRRRPVLVGAALLGTSIVFGLWHSPYGASAVLSTTASGLAFGLLALRSRSLVLGRAGPRPVRLGVPVRSSSPGAK